MENGFTYILPAKVGRMYYILKVGSLIKYFAGFPGKRTGICMQVIPGINTNKLAKRMLVGINQQFPQIVWENAFLERFFLDVCVVF